MRRTNCGDRACRQVLAILDSYIDGELVAGTNFILDGHFRLCDACTREVRLRKLVQERLRNAVGGIPVPEGLQYRIRSHLRDS